MEIEYKGANCIVITAKRGNIIIDPKLSQAGLKDYAGKATVQLATQDELSIDRPDTLLLSGPGEYEIEGMSIKGIAAQRHMDTPDQGVLSTIYKLDSGDISIAIIGHIAGQLNESQLEALGVTDVLILPVGGNGYTLDAHAAVQIVRQVEPKIVVPTHYADKALAYEVPQAGLEVFSKELGATPEPVAKLKLKAGSLPEVLTVYELARTS